uniref:CSON009785 protein n=1 Tax=Culicoides sonorensis TaxID=179676 RepID=A0A336MCX1_CULSO
MATMVNMTNLLNGKDSRWLQLEVCREFQRNKCTRVDTECKFAHPPANVEVQNGRVTACYDSIKGRCNREKPPCKYFHPPQHLKDQLLINGRNHLALKNALMQQMGITPGQAVLQGQLPVTTNPYLTSMPTNATYNPFYAPGHLVPTILGPDPNCQTVVQQAVPVAQQKIPRSDRIEAFHGMVPFKRPAADKSGIPVYQPGATTYQQLMQLQQPFVPVSCEYQTSSSSSTSSYSYCTPVSNNSTISSSHIATTSIPQTHSTVTSSATIPHAIINNNATLASAKNNNNHIFVNQNNVNNNNGVFTTSDSNENVTESNNNNNIVTNNKETTTNDNNTTNNSVSQYNSINDNTTAEDDLINSKKSKEPVLATNSSVSVGNVNMGNTIIYSTTSLSTSISHTASYAYSFPQAPASQNHFLQNSIYTNPAAIAKEVAQKNYANALKLAAASNALSGKPLSALTYTNIPFNKTALLQQPAYSGSPSRPALAPHISTNRLSSTTHPQNTSQILRAQNPFSTLQRVPSPQAYLTAAATNPYAQFMRAQTANSFNSITAALSQTNPYTAQAMQQAQALQAAAQMQAVAANQQFMFYHGLQQQQTQTGYPSTAGLSTSTSAVVQQHDDKVEIIDQRVAVCRDHALGNCFRQQCKYYHIPIELPPAPLMGQQNNKQPQSRQQQHHQQLVLE